VRFLAVVAVLGACAAEGEPVHEWTLDVEGGPHGIAVTLPSSPFRELPPREVDYTIRTRVALSHEQRGKTLTLSLDCYHGPLALVAGPAIDRPDGGTPIDDIGDTGVGEHRYVIPKQLTDTDALALAATARHDAAESGVFGFSAVPRLVVGARVERSAAATFNRYAIVLAGVVDIIFSVLWAILFVLDRRNRAVAAFAVALTGSLGWALWGIGVLPAWTLALSLAVFLLGFIYFVHYNFELGPPPRWLLAAVGLWSTRSTVVISLALNPLLLVQAAAGLVASAYIVWRLFQQARRGAKRTDARLLFGAWGVSVVTTVPQMGAVVTGHMLLAGWHIEYAASIAWILALLIVIGRQHVAHKRELEAAMAELQRQVAERSKALGDALTALAKQPRSLDDARTIDDRYRVVRRIGAGGMGAVYEVERVVDGEHLALKTLRGRTDPDSMARFAREAQIAAELSHPNLLRVLDVGIADGALFLVMPLVDGGSLEQARARFGDVAWARPIVAQIATGLAALHDRGIVHRDLKPANVLVAGGIVKIADFGLAAFGVDDGNTAPPSVAYASTGRITPDLTNAGAIFGTPGYMAPELAGGVRDVRTPSDVFAFGLIAHELIVGRAAFADPPLLARMAGRPITRPSFAGFDPLLARCLDLDPEARPSAAELADALGD
jgi:hypothetical protein